MQYTYLSSMLTTFEKIFGIKAQQTAYLMSGNEIAQVLFLFFLPLTMKVKKRPLWCSIGMVITSLGLYMMSLPHFISDHHHLLDTAPITAEADKDFRHNISFAWSNEAPDTEQSQVSEPILGLRDLIIDSPIQNKFHKSVSEIGKRKPSSKPPWYLYLFLFLKLSLLWLPPVYVAADMIKKT